MIMLQPRPPIVLIDLDNTVWEFNEPLLTRYNETFNANLSLEDITEYDFSDKIQIPVEQYFNKFLTKDYFETFKPYPDAVEAINELHFNKKCSIIFCSAGSPRTALWRLEKLDNLFGWFTAKDLILCKDKQMVRGLFLIDDCLDNFKPNHGLVPKYSPIIPDFPWNRNKEELKFCCGNPIRIFQWDYTVLSGYIEREVENILKGKRGCY